MVYAHIQEFYYRAWSETRRLSLFPYLFVTAVEILVIVVRNKDSGIKEIEINGLETKLLQFADHTFYRIYSLVTPFLVYFKNLRRPLV